MTKHICEYLSGCCDSEVLNGSELDFDEHGVIGVCSNCHEYTSFYDEGHTPWDYEYKPKPLVPKHDCMFVSVCCGARPLEYLDVWLTGLCSFCHDGTGFECEIDENCDNNTRTLVQEADKKRLQRGTI